ncbi:MAG: HEPN domain-containing protein [Phycisphaerales bacterium]|nr:HEPN domain-containing protein [Phycisphaerales bacterium]
MQSSKLLLEHGHFRAAVSRAYYSAYSMVTSGLIQSGHTVSVGERPNPSHAQVAVMIQHNLDKRRFDKIAIRELSRKVRRLYAMRLSADYAPQDSIEQAEALQAVRDASTVQIKLGDAFK